MPTFDGAIPFTLFGFMMVIAAYIRQLFITVEGSIDKLKRDGKAPYPFNHPSAAAQKEEQIDVLTDLRWWLAPITAFIFLLISALAFRTVIYALSPVQGTLLGAERHSFKVTFDLVVCVLIFTFVAFMWFMHSRGACKYNRIRREAIAAIEGRETVGTPQQILKVIRQTIGPRGQGPVDSQQLFINADNFRHTTLAIA
jgi:hypothetical protein